MARREWREVSEDNEDSEDLEIKSVKSAARSGQSEAQLSRLTSLMAFRAVSTLGLMFGAITSVTAAWTVSFWLISSKASASEMVSPSYLWDPVNSFSISRILICGDHPEKVDFHRGETPKGPRIALYRNMSSQYFTTRDETSLSYDVPLNMEVVEDNEKFQRLLFTQTDEDGSTKPFAELKVLPRGNPIWVRLDGKDHHRSEDRCRGYRFQAEFIHR